MGHYKVEFTIYQGTRPVKRKKRAKMYFNCGGHFCSKNIFLVYIDKEGTHC